MTLLRIHLIGTTNRFENGAFDFGSINYNFKLKIRCSF